MNWLSYPENTPNTGVHIASISTPHINGTFTFNYVAFYNADSNLWYKYDPFNPDNSQGEQITNTVNGWIDNMVTYFG